MTREAYKQLLKHLLINHGATLDKNGKHAKINGGYFVAVKTLIKVPLNALLLSDINEALQEAQKNNNVDYVGFEVIDGFVSVEHSIHCANIATAKIYAEKYKQKRVFSLNLLASLTTANIQ